VRPSRQPADGRFSVHPVGIHKSLALAARGFESRVAQRNTAFDADAQPAERGGATAGIKHQIAMPHRTKPP
jgi:hypothetical protein